MVLRHNQLTIYNAICQYLSAGFEVMTKARFQLEAYRPREHLCVVLYSVGFGSQSMP